MIKNAYIIISSLENPNDFYAVRRIWLEEFDIQLKAAEGGVFRILHDDKKVWLLRGTDFVYKDDLIPFKRSYEDAYVLKNTNKFIDTLLKICHAKKLRPLICIHWGMSNSAFDYRTCDRNFQTQLNKSKSIEKAIVRNFSSQTGPMYMGLTHTQMYSFLEKLDFGVHLLAFFQKAIELKNPEEQGNNSFSFSKKNILIDFDDFVNEWESIRQIIAYYEPKIHKRLTRFINYNKQTQQLIFSDVRALGTLINEITFKIY